MSNCYAISVSDGGLCNFCPKEINKNTDTINEIIQCLSWKGGNMRVYNNVENVSTEFVKNNLSKKDSKSGKANGYNTEDSVELSSELNNLEDLKNQTANMGSIRQGKVNGIKLQVNDGRYKISSEDIAEKIIDEHIVK